MKIVYFANFSDTEYGFTKDIESSLKKLGHKVESINDRDFDFKDLLGKTKKADLFLFNQGGVYTENEMYYSVSVQRLKQMLAAITCKKVCWFTDKVWFLNNNTMEDIIPLTDYVFLNDDTWVRRHKYPNVFPLHMGLGSALKGNPSKEYVSDIAFYGTVYGFNKPFIEFLKKEYGSRCKVFHELQGQDLADLMVSTKMVFTPVQPYDEFYWSERIYQILGHQGVALFPRLTGLEEEGFVAGKHYLGYKRTQDLKEIIDYYLLKPQELETIAKEGYEFVQKFSYKSRLKEMFTLI